MAGFLLNFNSGEGDRKKEAGVCLLPQSSRTDSWLMSCLSHTG